LRLPFLRFRAP